MFINIYRIINVSKYIFTNILQLNRKAPTFFFFFYNDPATTEFSPLPLHDALPIWVNPTAGNSAWDAQPVFLANGDLAWLAQERPGFESDRFHIVLKDAHTGAVRSLTGGWDRTIHRLGATPDGKALLAGVDELGQAPLYRIDPKSGAPVRLVAGGAVEAFGAARERVVFARADLGGPDDLYEVGPRGGPTRRL